MKSSIQRSTKTLPFQIQNPQSNTFQKRHLFTELDSNTPSNTLQKSHLFLQSQIQKPHQTQCKNPIKRIAKIPSNKLQKKPIKHIAKPHQTCKEWILCLTHEGKIAQVHIKRQIAHPFSDVGHLTKHIPNTPSNTLQKKRPFLP